MKCENIELNFRDTDSGLIELDCPSFHLRTRPALRFDGEELSPTGCILRRDDGEELCLEYQFGGQARLTLSFAPADGGIGLRAWLLNTSGSEQLLGEVILLQSSPDSGALALGGDPARVMVMEQGNYWGKVRPLSVVEENGRASPEDRWAVLAATLPPLGTSAQPVDLFEPVTDGGAFAYATTQRGEDAVGALANEHPPGSVWYLRVEADWDAWDLVGVFSFAGESGADTPRISRYAIPFERLGLPPETVRQGFEFWSGQYLGTIPSKRTNAGGYAHPGDMQDLKSGDAPGFLDIAFFGPGAKLICLRQVRPHPWVVGTSFHQSCGAELRQVAWDPESLTLSGEIDRPAGETGLLILDGAGLRIVSAEGNGQSSTFRRGAEGAWIVPLTVSQPGMGWRVAFAAELEGGQ